ncbi:hypothetical protein P0L94_05625 [Microbacter sp. GSS18]|nr:hypothetical protein P0L94_05625 [Microbacter sp. GSS18]
MDYTTSVGFGLSQHQAADLARETEQRRSIGERLDRGAGAANGGRVRRARMRAPRIVIPVVGVALMGGLLGFAALPSLGPAAPVYPATVVVDSGSGGGSAMPFTAN